MIKTNKIISNGKKIKEATFDNDNDNDNDKSIFLFQKFQINHLFIKENIMHKIN